MDLSDFGGAQGIQMELNFGAKTHLLCVWKFDVFQNLRVMGSAPEAGPTGKENSLRESYLKGEKRRIIEGSYTPMLPSEGCGGS